MRISDWSSDVCSSDLKTLIREAAKAGDEAAQKQALGTTHWIDNLSYEDALTRLAQEPTVNIEGLVAGYTGPGGKTILPGRAVAKLDLRRSEERRVGQEWVSTCRSRGWPYHITKKRTRSKT